MYTGPPAVSLNNRFIPPREHNENVGESVRDDSRDATSWVLTTVALIVKKSDLDPNSVTEKLGLQPSAVRMPGIDRWNPEGDAAGQWRLQCDEHTTRAFPEQLDIILRAAEGCADTLAALRAEGCEVTIVVRGFADNDSQVSFSAGEMARVSRLNIPLKIIPNLNAR
ncbi:DUF4279 domain-containing protein [Streptomyces scopuliridis]|uniref:DUF4279 domain-containing protein n=1 Tax=Streptomyces scopuliridis TaxID=452529 RepID=UPI0036C3BBB5